MNKVLRKQSKLLHFSIIGATLNEVMKKYVNNENLPSLQIENYDIKDMVSGYLSTITDEYEIYVNYDAIKLISDRVEIYVYLDAVQFIIWDKVIGIQISDDDLERFEDMYNEGIWRH